MNKVYQGYRRLAAETITLAIKQYCGIQQFHFPTSKKARVETGEWLRSTDCFDLARCIDMENSLLRFCFDVGLITPILQTTDQGS